MRVFKKLFGKKASSPAPDGMDEHLVRVHIPLPDTFPTAEELTHWAQLEDLLGERAESTGVGSLDGNEAGGGELTIWLYGRDGKRLADILEPAVKEFGVPAGTTIFVRQGGVQDPSAHEETRRIT